MKKVALLLAFSSIWSLFAQPYYPKRELRAAWIATVKNVDWPSKPGLSTAEMQAELTELLDLCQENGLNAVVFQVRPAADAFYDSQLEPWSEWLSGVQGQPPSPYFDPLAWMVEECHRRGMELHAWFNPYRAIVDTVRAAPLAENHIARRYPEWLLQYGKNTYFDPGLPMAREHVIRVIMDVVRRYDIDAVHFDDYFYPYKIEGVDFPDSLSYAEYGAGMPLDEWRRSNVDTLIHLLSDSIHGARPWVKFGISPFGVWRNVAQDPMGSKTQAGQTCYDDLYADIRKWAAKGWIDYLAPQAYFSIGYPVADYAELVDWWSRSSFGRHVYVGQALYKINNNHDQNWAQPAQLPDQIRMNRSYREVKGSMYFSIRQLRNNPLGVNDSLRSNLYRYPALPPEMSWRGGRAPEAPPKLKVRSVKQGLALKWDPEGLPQGTRYLAIYRFPRREVNSLFHVRNLVRVVGVKAGKWVDDTPRFLQRYTYVVTGMDRLFAESAGSPPLKTRRWTGLFGKKKD